jgi:hypothetical protein
MVKYFGDFTYDYNYKLTRTSEDQPPPPTMSEDSPEGTLDGPGFVTTNNILLEYGEADLEEHFLNNLPPSLPTKIISFWKDLQEVPEEVYRLQSQLKSTDGRELAGYSQFRTSYLISLT